MLYSHFLKKLCVFPVSNLRASSHVVRFSKAIFQKRFIATAQTTPILYSEHTPSDGDHIYVAMSSGVDSSTTAALMAQKYPGRVSGVFMNNWSATSKCAEADWNDVQRVASFIGIPCQRVSFEKDYWMEVFEPMLEGYRNGYTPNPDVGCNRHIKFGALFEFLKQQMKKDNKNWWLATGHYAKVLKYNPTGISHLLRPADPNKDQSYYLSTVDPKALAKLLFPMAQYTKPEIRTIAANFQLPTAFKPDSQGLCFVSNEHNHFKDFLAEYIHPNPGDIVLQDGTVVGKHSGLWTATVGQKPPGLSMPQGNPEYKGSWFVCDKIIEKNQLVIVRGNDNPELFSKRVHGHTWIWMDDKSNIDLSNVDSLRVQYRSLQTPVPISKIDLASSNGVGSYDTVDIIFKEPKRAVAPGQNIVLYQNDRVLGCGIVGSASRE